MPAILEKQLTRGEFNYVLMVACSFIGVRWLWNTNSTGRDVQAMTEQYSLLPAPNNTRLHPTISCGYSLLQEIMTHVQSFVICERQPVGIQKQNLCQPSHNLKRHIYFSQLTERQKLIIVESYTCNHMKQMVHHLITSIL